MNATTTITSTGVQKSMKVLKEPTEDFEAKKAELLKGLEEIKEKEAEQQKQALMEEANKLIALRQKKKDLLDQVKKFEEMSLKAHSADDKVFYAQEAIDCQNEANEISLPEDVYATQEEIETPGIFEKLLSSVGTVWGALAIFVLVAFLANYMVFKIADEINLINKLAQDAGNLSQMVPPSIGKMSFQKGWFTWMTISIDLIALILIMALIAPDKLFFLLPFTKHSVKAWKSFSNQPEEQKQWQAFAYVALILLFLAISHLGGK